MRDPITDLTPHQRTLLHYRCRGMSNRLVGDIHFISEKAVKNTLWDAYRRLGITKSHPKWQRACERLKELESD